MSSIFVGAIIELGVVIGVIYFIKQLQKKQTRQPALSKKIIKNLKF